MKVRRKILAPIIGGIVFMFLIFWAVGVFRPPSVKPGMQPAVAGETAPAKTLVVKPQTLDVFYEAVGSVQPRQLQEVSAQITARILTIKVEEGAPVTEGQDLVYLNREEFETRKSEATNALVAAGAALQGAMKTKNAADALLIQAQKTFDRTKKNHDQGAATDEELEDAQAKLDGAKANSDGATAAIDAAKAQVQRAEEVVREADIALGYTALKSSLNGFVMTKSAEVGDLAWPGKTLLTIYKPKDMLFEANVREGLINEVKAGMKVKVELPSLLKTVDGEIENVLTIDPRTRSFLIKVKLPEDDKLSPNLFGKVRIPIGMRQGILIPRGAIIQVGQLQMVLTRADNRWERRYITTGETVGDNVEALSGLSEGDEIGIKP